MENLPCEILQEIIKYFRDQEDLLSLSSVSQSLNYALKTCTIYDLHISQREGSIKISDFLKTNTPYVSVTILKNRYNKIMSFQGKKFCKCCGKYDINALVRRNVYFCVKCRDTIIKCSKCHKCDKYSAIIEDNILKKQIESKKLIVIDNGKDKCYKCQTEEKEYRKIIEEVTFGPSRMHKIATPFFY